METGIISQLSSQLKSRSNEANKSVAAKCLNKPALLDDIAKHLKDKNNKLIADCAEVMTEVALQNPALIHKYASSLADLIHHKENRVRWEAMHSIVLVADSLPEVVFSILPDLEEIMKKDASVIVRDYATESVCRYAGTGKKAAEKAFPLLIEILNIWGERHAGRALEGLINVYSFLPGLKNELGNINRDYLTSSKGVVKKAANRLEKILNK